MQRSNADGLAPISSKSNADKRAWNQPTIADESIENTAATKVNTTESGTTQGTGS